MQVNAEIVILPAPRCRRSKRVLEYLDAHGIPYSRIELDSPEGEEMVTRYGFRASPGILVDGTSINPFELLVQPNCRIDEAKAQKIFKGAGD